MQFEIRTTSYMHKSVHTMGNTNTNCVWAMTANCVTVASITDTRCIKWWVSGLQAVTRDEYYELKLLAMSLASTNEI